MVNGIVDVLGIFAEPLRAGLNKPLNKKIAFDPDGDPEEGQEEDDSMSNQDGLGI